MTELERASDHRTRGASMGRVICLAALLLGTGGVAQAQPVASKASVVAVVEFAPPAAPRHAPMLLLRVARDGRLFLGQTALPSTGSPAERMDSLAHVLASNPRLEKDGTLALEIDDSAPFRELVAVLDALRRAGLKRVEIIHPLPTSPLPRKRR